MRLISLYTRWVIRNNSLKQIYEHFGNTIEESEFVDIYKYAMFDPYGFLYIDTDPKEESMRFRKGFNEYIRLKK